MRAISEATRALIDKANRLYALREEAIAECRRCVDVDGDWPRCSARFDRIDHDWRMAKFDAVEALQKDVGLL